jgi:RNA polymerase sigma factor (sigma-70 family)
LRGQKESTSDGASARHDIAARIDILVRDHRDVAVAYATRILGDAHLAEDAVQRALLQIVLRMRSGDTELLAANPRAVVLRGTRWAALKIAERRAARGQGERRAANVAGVDESEDWDRAEARLLIADILPSLPPHYQDVLRLRYLEGHPDAIAAERLQVSLKAYRRRLDRALYWARLVALRIGASLMGCGIAALLRRAWRGVEGRVVAADGALWTRISAASTPGRASMVSVVLTAAMLGLIAPPSAVPAPRPGVARHASVAGGGRARGVREVDTVQSADATPATGTGLSLRTAGGAAAGAGLARPAGALGPGAGAAAETIDDVAVTEMAAAPSRGGAAPLLIANGSGARCDCPVLLESGDAGATWRAAPSPGAGLLLPPSYPTDPRIFVRGGYAWAGQVFCALPRFGARGCQAMPSVPQGVAVLDPAFDAGSPVVYVSTLAGLVAYDVPTGALHTLLPNTSDPLDPMPVAAAGGIGPAAVYLLTAGAQGTPRGAAAAQSDPAHAAPVVGSGRLAACGRAGRCADTAILPDRPYLVATDRDEAGWGVLASTAGVDSVHLSGDGGTSHQDIAMPQGRWIGGLQLFESAGRVALSALLHGAGGSVTLAWWRAGDAAPRLVPLSSTAPPLDDGASVRWGEGRVVAAAGVRGVRCSADWGQTWSATCSAP